MKTLYVPHVRALASLLLLLPQFLSCGCSGGVASVVPATGSQCEEVPIPLVLHLALSAAREDLEPLEVKTVLVQLSARRHDKFAPSLTTPPDWGREGVEPWRCFWVSQADQSEIKDCRFAETPDASMWVQARWNCASGSFGLKFHAPQSGEEIEAGVVTGRPFHVWLDGQIGPPAVLKGGCFPALADAELSAWDVRPAPGVAIGTRCRPLMRKLGPGQYTPWTE